MPRKKRGWNVCCVDCIKGMQAIGSGAVDLVFADPPFNIGYHYDTYRDDKRATEYVAWSKKWIAAVYDVLQDHGTFWLAIGDEFVSELDIVAKEIGFYKRSHVVWHYTFGVACPKNFARSHTHLLYYTKHRKKFTFNAMSPAVRVKSSRQLVYNDKRANPSGKLPDNTWVLSPLDLERAFSKAEDTWLASRVCGTFRERAERGTYQKHKGCPQMPEEILRRIILACSNRGDYVVDPFLGTGTTGAMAVALGRLFAGFDIDKLYCRRARERILAVAQVKKSLEDR
jgi:DNA modification methylase